MIRRLLGLLEGILYSMAWGEMRFRCPAPGCPYMVMAERRGPAAWTIRVIHPYRSQPHHSGSWPQCPQHHLHMVVE